jgi:UDP-glucose 4-epimerase
MTGQFKDKRLLIVGGAGFVGSNLVAYLLQEEPKEIIVVDNLLSSEGENIPRGSTVRCLLGSITDDRVLSELPSDLDYIWHLACYHGNQSSIHDPIADFQNNALTSLRLFEHLKYFQKIQKVVYSSAGCCVAKKTFDDPEATTEDAPVSLYQDSPYSISKIIGELYGNYYWKQHELPVVKARFQNVYGPREILGAGRWRGTSHTVWRNVTPTFIWKALMREALPLENDGAATRDFIYVDDVVRGLIACATFGTPGGVYNLATGVETSIKELAQLINEIAQNPTSDELQPRRAWDGSGRRYAAVEKSRTELGFRAQVTIREGIERTIAWTREHSETIERCIQRHDRFMAPT